MQYLILYLFSVYYSDCEVNTTPTPKRKIFLQPCTNQYGSAHVWKAPYLDNDGDGGQL